MKNNRSYYLAALLLGTLSAIVPAQADTDIEGIGGTGQNPGDDGFGGTGQRPDDLARPEFPQRPQALDLPRVERPDVQRPDNVRPVEINRPDSGADNAGNPVPDSPASGG